MQRRALLALGGVTAAGLVVGGLVQRDDGSEQAPATSPQPARHRYGDVHKRQVGELHRPPAGVAVVGTVVMLHGGFWQPDYDLSLQDDVAADLAGRGWVVWNLDYRATGEGADADGWTETFDDVRAGVAHLAALDLPAEARGLEPVLLGHSAGGHLAAWVAGEDTGDVRPAAVVPMAGVLDLTGAARAGTGGDVVPALMGGGPEQVPDRYARADPLLRVPLAVPVRAVHGESDIVVPPGQSERYVEAARAAGGDARLVVTSGGHFDALDPRTPMWHRTVAVLAALSS